MQQRDDLTPTAQRSDPELADALAERVLAVVAQLSPPARSRLVAFFDLLEEPGSMLAELVADRSGVMRLTLTHTGAPAGSKSN